MAITSTRTFDTDPQAIEFPCMGMFKNGNIAIMTSATEGIIIYTTDVYLITIGQHIRFVDPASWKPYFGSVTIEWED